MSGPVKCRCDCCGIIYRVETEEDVKPCIKCGGGRIYVMGRYYIVLDVAQSNAPVVNIIEEQDE